MQEDKIGDVRLEKVLAHCERLMHEASLIKSLFRKKLLASKHLAMNRWKFQTQEARNSKNMGRIILRLLKIKQSQAFDLLKENLAHYKENNMKLNRAYKAWTRGILKRSFHGWIEKIRKRRHHIETSKKILLRMNNMTLARSFMKLNHHRNIRIRVKSILISSIRRKKTFLLQHAFNKILKQEQKIIDQVATHHIEILQKISQEPAQGVSSFAYFTANFLLRFNVGNSMD